MDLVRIGNSIVTKFNHKRVERRVPAFVKEVYDVLGEPKL